MFLGRLVLFAVRGIARRIALLGVWDHLPDSLLAGSADG
jgi:hypothetical protein